MSSVDKDDLDHVQEKESSEIDLLSFHEKRAGRLVIDPEYVLHHLRYCIMHLPHGAAGKPKSSLERL